MNAIAFYAASRDQLNYFTQLCEQVGLPSRVLWYKKLKFPSLTFDLPWSALWQQARLLKVRKQNSRKGKHYPKWVWPLYQSLYFLNAIWLFLVATKWLKVLPETHVGIWNGKKFRQAIVVLAAEKQHKKTIFFETGPLPGFSAIDPKGVNFYSSIPHQSTFYRNRGIKHAPILSATHAQANVAKETPSGVPAKFILVPFQVVEDSNIYLHSKWIRNMRQLFELCRQLTDILPPEYVFVFKEHPACNESYEDLRAQQTERLQFIDSLSTPDLANYAQAIMTVNSTVGIEGLMKGLPVFVLGDALFAIDEMSFPVNSQAALAKLITQVDCLKPNTDIINSFLEYLREDYAIPGNAMNNPDTVHWQAAEKRLQLLLNGKEAQALGL